MREELAGQRCHRLLRQGPQALMEGVGRIRRAGGQGSDGHGRAEGRQGGRMGDQRTRLDHPDVRHRQDRRNPADDQHQLPERRAGLRAQAVRHELSVPDRRNQARQLSGHRVRAHTRAEDAAQGQLPQREVPPSEDGVLPRTREAPWHVLHGGGQIIGHSNIRHRLQTARRFRGCSRCHHDAVHLGHHRFPERGHAHALQYCQRRILAGGQHELRSHRPSEHQRPPVPLLRLRAGSDGVHQPRRDHVLRGVLRPRRRDGIHRG